MNKYVLLNKGKQTKDMVDMEEYAWGLKVDRILKASIIEYFTQLTSERLTWDQICDKYKLGDYEYNQLKSYTQLFATYHLIPSKKNSSFPKSAITLLNHLYRASTVKMQRKVLCHGLSRQLD